MPFTTVLYFEEVGMGLVAIVMSLKKTEMSYSRFSTRMMPGSWNRSKN